LTPHSRRERVRNTVRFSTLSDADRATEYMS
jgi:hypothetical protein